MYIQLKLCMILESIFIWKNVETMEPSFASKDKVKAMFPLMFPFQRIEIVLRTQNLKRHDECGSVILETSHEIKCNHAVAFFIWCLFAKIQHRWNYEHFTHLTFNNTLLISILEAVLMQVILHHLKGWL